MPVRIAGVTPGGLLDGLAYPGEMLRSIDGRDINDVLDYMYHGAGAQLTLRVADKSGAERNIAVAKSEYADLGLEFDSFLMDSQQSCANKCIFCFIDQLPREMRDTLYFKDDDARMSFLRGSYITLTNLSERDIDRIIELRISPVNISVHATDPLLRARIMGNPRAAEGYTVMRRLSDAGIELGCQIVLMPGINDGEQLARTMDDLAALAGVTSVSVVPVGLTRHRDGLYPLLPYTPDGARGVIERVTAFGDRIARAGRGRVFYLADEFFIKAGLPLPPPEYYDDYPQLENGVGLMALFAQQFRSELLYLPADCAPRRVALITGVAAAEYMRGLAGEARARLPGLVCDVIAAENRHFGQNVDVAGLLCGCDLLYAYKRSGLQPDELLIPACCLNFDGDRFLDDLTLVEFASQCGCAVRVCPVDGVEFANMLAGVKIT